MVKNLPTIPETWVRSMHWEDPWRRERLPNPVFWPAGFHRLYSPWGRSVGHDWAIFASLYLASSRWLNGKKSACNERDMNLIPGSGRSPRRGNGNPHQYSCLENPMDRGAWWATVAKELDTTERLNSCCGRSKLIQHRNGITQRVISLGLAFPHVQTGWHPSLTFLLCS